MRIPSRQMPKFVPKPVGRWAWVVLAALAAGLLYAVVSAPKAAAVGIAVLLALSGWAHLDLKRQRLKLEKLAATRRGQSICEFARDFDTRQVDTWIIRAVYEHLQEQLTYAHPAFPVRATDRLKEDLRLDPDDIDLDVLVQVEQRTGRSLNHTRDNPYYGLVQTAGDLVLFFQAQPRAG
jgi:hypothetical protein